jgi:hypothetical protein
MVPPQKKYQFNLIITLPFREINYSEEKHVLMNCLCNAGRFLRSLYDAAE